MGSIVVVVFQMAQTFPNSMHSSQNELATQKINCVLDWIKRGDQQVEGSDSHPLLSSHVISLRFSPNIQFGCSQYKTNMSLFE